MYLGIPKCTLRNGYSDKFCVMYISPQLENKPKTNPKPAAWDSGSPGLPERSSLSAAERCTRDPAHTQTRLCRILTRAGVRDLSSPGTVPFYLLSILSTTDKIWFETKTTLGSKHCFPKPLQPSSVMIAEREGSPPVGPGGSPRWRGLRQPPALALLQFHGSISSWRAGSAPS